MKYLLIENQARIGVSLFDEMSKNYPWASRHEILNVKMPLPLVKPINGKHIIKVVLTNYGYEKLAEYVAKIADIAHIVFTTESYNEEVILYLRTKFPDIKMIKKEPSEEDLINFIKTSLEGISNTACDNILKFLRRNEGRIVRFVSYAKGDSKSYTIGRINELLREFKSATFWDLYMYFLIKKGIKKEILELVYKYRHGYKMFKKYLLNELKVDIEIFYALMDSKLTQNNISSYSAGNRINKGRVKRSMQLYSKITVESLELKRVHLEQVHNIISLYELIFLTRK